MAKTLIGNIKGKDGRGIASISKTGTTGSVDTYTIRYTDNTTSTYTVNNSDGISLQRQIVPSAAVESSATASRAYAAGDYVVVNGVLRKVKSSIVKGGHISDSNSTATTVTGELANLASSSAPRVFVGYKVVNFNNANYTTLWDKAGFAQEFGRGFDNSRDCVYAMNGNASYDFMVSGVNYYPRDEQLVVAISGTHTGSFRVNYIVALG
jgi:hypothetical protein